jgi:hypothetical protein
MDVPKANAAVRVDKSSCFQQREKVFAYFARMRSKCAITCDDGQFSRSRGQPQLGILFAQNKYIF